MVSAYTADHDASFLRNRNPWLAGPLIGGIVAAFIGLSAIAGEMLADRLLQSELNDWPRMVAAQMENAALAAAAPIATPGPAKLAIPAQPETSYPPANDADSHAPDSTVSDDNPSDIETASLRMHGPADAEQLKEPADESGPSSAEPEEIVLTVREGDTLMGLLLNGGIATEDANGIVSALAPLYKPRRLMPGQEIHVTMDPASQDQPERLASLTLNASVERDITVRRDEDHGFVAEAIERPLTRTLTQAAGKIESSLYQSARQENVPPAVLAELIQLFSYDVDFQRDIHPGDGFALMYEDYLDQDGKLARNGNILVAALTLGDKTTRVYRHTTSDGETDYYDAKGQSIRKALLRTPIDGARISSRFGKRMHPILGYTKMHQGLDFAAPRGTPIYAAGDGVVEMAQRYGGYGNYVRIRHNGTFETAYAHMKKFGRGIHKGTRVRQGQIIGYVGTTGRSTGPHLHYEVIRNDRRVNPQGIQLPTGRKLAGKELDRFQAARKELDTQYALVAEGTKTADAATAPR